MNHKKLAGRLGAGLAASASMLLVPVLAFAEDSESSSGLELLIPKPAEFVPALIVFLVIVLILGKFVWPIVLKTLDEREERIEGGIRAGEQAKEQAEKSRKESEAIVADARRQASQIVLDAHNQAEKDHARIVAEAREEAGGIVAQARLRAEDDRRRTYEEVTDTVAKVSVAVAGKIVNDTLVNDEEKQRKLIKKYLEEVGNLDA